MPAIVHSLEELRGIRDTWAHAGESVALVPTMGSLHAGHRELVREAISQADRCVVSIFVNPLQFGTGEDFESYPRSLAADEAFLGDTMVDVIFAPGVEDMYPEGVDAIPTIHAGPVGATFEGTSRPGHFDGVLTVVKRLFDYVAPDVAVFGQKDAQQLFLIQHMVEQQHLGLRILAVETVRDADGIALSSRNALLSEAGRKQALALPQALLKAEHADTPDQARSVALAVLEDTPGVSVDYVEVVDPATFVTLVDPQKPQDARLIVAVIIDGVRLIDNRLLHFGQ